MNKRDTVNKDEMIKTMFILSKKKNQKEIFNILSDEEIETLLEGVGLFLIAYNNTFIDEIRELAREMLFGVSDENLH